VAQGVGPEFRPQYQGQGLGGIICKLTSHYRWKRETPHRLIKINDMVVHACNPSYTGGIGKRIKVRRQTLGYVPSGTAPAQQAQVLSSNPNTVKKKKGHEVNSRSQFS
jgi:hypothetical protein